jgi:uncharacterized membrane-anchored protein YjiN (DUF445 family)
MKDFDDEVGGLRKILGSLMNGLNGALMMDDESRAIIETHYLKAQSEILAGYQQVISKRLKALEVGKAPRKIVVE